MKVVALGEIMLRLSTPDNTKITENKYFNSYYGGGEYNTLVSLSGLGYDTSIITSLPTNELATRVKIEARKYSVSTDSVICQKGRLGTYYTLLGDEISSTTVIYDRASSTFSESKFTDYDFKKIFSEADHFHISGITPALGENTQEMSLKAIKLAKKMGLTVSYDSNYRAKLWSQENAGIFLKEIMPLVDYLFIGILDIKYLLGIEVDNLEQGYKMLKDKYPNIRYFASTNRNVISTCQHELSVNLYQDKLLKTKTVKINVKDRIGGGDAFTAGVLAGIFSEKSEQEIAEFALATAVYKHYQYGDNCHMNQQEIMQLMSGTSFEIKR